MAVIVANNDAATTNEATPVAIPILLNDRLDGVAPTTRQVAINITKQPDHGTIQLDASGVVSYTPDAGFVGTDNFQYNLTTGPTLSGALPDGTVGLSWAGGAYVAADGTPPYTFTSLPGTTWPGNLGPMDSAGVVASETPTTAGTGTNVVEVEDANGLTAGLTDEFEIGIAPATMMASQRAGSAIYSVEGGIVWTACANNPMAANGGLAAVAPGRFVATLRYTDDLGATAWQVGTTTETRNFESTVRGATVVSGSNGPFEPVSISVDSGATFTSGGVTSDGMYSNVFVGSTLVAVGKLTTFQVSADNGATYTSTGTAHGISANNTNHNSCKYSGGGVFVGTNLAATALRVLFSADGVTFTGGDITGLGSTTIGVGKRASKCIAGAVDGVETIVVIGDGTTEELFWTDNPDDASPTWHLVTSPLGAGYNLDTVCWNGVRFVLGGRNGSNVGALMYSSDLITWLPCTMPAGSQGYLAMAAQDLP